MATLHKQNEEYLLTARADLAPKFDIEGRNLPGLSLEVLGLTNCREAADAVPKKNQSSPSPAACSSTIFLNEISNTFTLHLTNQASPGRNSSKTYKAFA